MVKSKYEVRFEFLKHMILKNDGKKFEIKIIEYVEEF
jgi:hypothetical protein